MNLIKKNIQKTSGTRNRYKPGQLVTINHHVFRIVKGRCRNDDCIHCFDYIAIDLISVFINYHQICI